MHLPAPTRRRVWLAAAAFVIAPGWVWAVSTPLFGSPDEQAHVIRAVSIWYGSLDRGEVAIQGGLVNVEAVAPQIFANSSAQLECWVGQPTVTPRCAPLFAGSREPDTMTTSAGLHPHLYYSLVGWIGRLLPSYRGVVLMRMFGAVLCGALIGSMAVTAWTRHRPLTLLAGLVGLTPVALWLSGTVNPNGFEVCAAIGVWVHGLALFDSWRQGTFAPEVARRFSVAVAALALVRPLSPLFTVIIVALCALAAGLGPRRALAHREGRLVATVTIVALGLAAAWQLYGGLLTIQLEDQGLPEGTSAFEGTFGLMVAYLQQMVGAFSWLDAGIAGFPVISWVLLGGGLLSLAFLLGDRRAWWVAGLTVLVALAVPIATQYGKVSTNGLVWQGRYGLPVWVGVPVLCARALEHVRWPPVPLRRRVVVAIGTLIVVGHAGGWWSVMQRWTVGMGNDSWWLGAAVWRPPSVPLWFLPIAFVAAVSVPLAVLGRWLLRTWDPPKGDRREDGQDEPGTVSEPAELACSDRPAPPPGSRHGSPR
jgi:hypothetical protein